MTDNFLASVPENIHLNQYWYSQHTIDSIVNEIVAVNTDNQYIAYLSTPSIYFNTVKRNKKLQCYLFDYDTTLAKSVDIEHFIPYNFNDITTIPTHLHNKFDYIVIDPPFVTEQVWQKYTDACKLLLKPGYTDTDTVQHTAVHTVASSFIDPTPQQHNIAIQTTKQPNGKILLSTIPENADMLLQMLDVRLTCFRPSIPNLIYQYSLYTNYNSILLNQINKEVDYDLNDMPDQYKKQQRIQTQSFGSSENLVTVDELNSKHINNTVDGVFHTSRKQAVVT